MVENINEIEGRGGPAFTYLRSAGLAHEFLLVAGASRERQFDDFWKVKVTLDQQGFKLTHEKLNFTEKDGFSARNGLTAALS